MAAKDFIVAIELGSSKITGIAGKKSMDGSIQVLAVVREDATSCIRKGVVYNIDKTSVCLTNVIKKLKTLLKSEISQVYVGVGGQSIRSMRNVIIKKLPLTPTRRFSTQPPRNTRSARNTKSTRLASKAAR